MEFVPYSLRHSYSARLGEAGAGAFTIMRLMGHSSVTVSQKYVHPSPETMERAVQRLQTMNRDGRGPHNFHHSDEDEGDQNAVSYLFSTCPGGETGRRKGLKILFPATEVWVRVPPRAHQTNNLT